MLINSEKPPLIVTSINLDKVTRISSRINYSYDISFDGINDFVPISRAKIKDLKELLEL
ncbi:LytTR family transcriptional regulator DNA-binding domain-containing protein [Mobilitalea sibirica]|uniref:LytTR family transcriptional regulator DNA-binding domain-containing protein n=1 Tax=Mobilitalea sibirica TaxID=1462919 RepID=A0A8J7HDF3_9FIRM|nr:LytTR family transcriptional regulator DNA-binding domain-containing protein [Mobilitalea sibirica]